MRKGGYIAIQSKNPYAYIAIRVVLPIVVWNSKTMMTAPLRAPFETSYFLATNGTSSRI